MVGQYNMNLIVGRKIEPTNKGIHKCARRSQLFWTFVISNDDISPISNIQQMLASRLLRDFWKGNPEINWVKGLAWLSSSDGIIRSGQLEINIEVN
jgi:hypothetical protein